MRDTQDINLSSIYTPFLKQASINPTRLNEIRLPGLTDAPRTRAGSSSVVRVACHCFDLFWVF